MSEPSFTEEECATLGAQRYAVCVGDFYEDLAERLIAGARAGFGLGGVPEEAVEVHRIPGAFELPLAARWCASSGRYAGVACLGVVIRGETDHYELICSEAARGIQDVALQSSVPCSFGVITCDTMEQALARATGDRRDQGRSAALAVLRMLLVRRALS